VVEELIYKKEIKRKFPKNIKSPIAYSDRASYFNGYLKLRWEASLLRLPFYGVEMNQKFKYHIGISDIAL